MEEFQSEEEEPWYDQQDLEQGKDGDTPQAARDGGLGGCGGRKGGKSWVREGGIPSVKHCICLAKPAPHPAAALLWKSHLCCSKSLS